MKNIYRLIGVVLLLAIAIHRLATAHAPVGVEQYQKNIRMVAEKLPHTIDGWVGKDVPVPVQAVTLLRPNVMLSRKFLNVETGESVGVLFVHCSDAHSMAGHFPLRCYPAQGWKTPKTPPGETYRGEPRDWLVGNLMVTGTEYQFHMEELGTDDGESAITVANCILRPNGQILRDMDAMAKSIVGAGGQTTGAGQIQVWFDSRVPREKRDATIVSLLAGYKPVIQAVIANP